MNPNPEAVMAAPSGIREDVGAVMTPSPYPRGQTPFVQHIDEAGFIDTYGEPREGVSPEAVEAAMDSDASPDQKVERIVFAGGRMQGRSVKNEQEQLETLIDIVADGKTPQIVTPASPGKSTANDFVLPFQLNAVLAAGNRVRAKGIKPGTRNFRRLLEKELKKKGLPVHERKLVRDAQRR